MPLKDLSDADRQIVLECLHAAANGPFFPGGEFSTLLGWTRDEICEITERWPNLDDSDEDTYAIISNAMNWLIFYPIREKHLWPDYISVSRKEVFRIFSEWRGSVPKSPVDGFM